MQDKMKELIQKALNELDIISSDIEISIPKDSQNGNYSTNIAMKLSKTMQKNPMDIANMIKEKISSDLISNIEIKSPGFINFFVKNDYLYELINTIIKENDNYGKSDIGKGKSYNIEFVSANPTGILHMGNARGGAYGDSLARILKFVGYDVTKEYYINDAGTQIDNLGLSIQAKYLQMCGLDKEIPENGYHGPEIGEIAKEIFEAHNKEWIDEPLDTYKNLGIEKFLGKIIKALEDYRITYDVFTSEKEIYKQYPLQNIVDNMTKNGYTYVRDGATWFKSSEFYDDKDHVLIRSDGNYTYLVPDIGNHINKYKRNFTKMIDVLGTDHHGYVARLKGAIKASGYDDTKLEVKLLQLVRLLNGEEVVKMSKRTGNTITLSDLINDVGVNAARYFFSMHSLDTQMDFDMKLAKEKSSENPVYYVSYAYARICSILNEYENVGMLDDYSCIKNEETSKLLGIVSQFPEVVKKAASKELPHLITNYVYELATAFHVYYSKNRIIVADKDVLKANLNMIKAVKITIHNALNLIGVIPPERM